MIEAERPEDELERLKALYSYEILDTNSEEAFDAITRLASRLCNTPVALVTLIDVDRQWFKSRVGISENEGRRELSYCAHSILNPNELLIVSDALKDERFKGHPSMATDQPMRSYAGAPIVVEGGYALGTVCVADYRAREFTAAEQEDLKALALQASALLNLRQHILRFKQMADSKMNSISETKTQSDNQKISGDVLIAEDSIEIQKLINLFLSTIGLKTKCVTNGFDAIREAKTGQYDLILMDHQMPECDGITATKEIRSLGMVLPIIALTASVKQEDIMAFEEAGANGSIKKPFTSALLLETVKSYLRERPSFDHPVEPDSTLVEIINKFLDGLKTRLYEIETHVRNADWKSVKRSAHSLRRAGLFGFYELGLLAGDLEDTSLSENIEARERAFKSFKESAEYSIANGVNAAELPKGKSC